MKNLENEIIKFENLENISVKDLQHHFLGQQFENIDKSNALYIYNAGDKNIREHYVGGNSIILMGYCFANNKPIFLYNTPKIFETMY